MDLKLLRDTAQQVGPSLLILIVLFFIGYDSCISSPLRRKVAALEKTISTISTAIARVDERTQSILMLVETYANH